MVRLTESETYAWYVVSRDAETGDELPTGEVERMGVFTATAAGIDNEAPELTIPDAPTVVAGEPFDPMDGVSVVDNTDGVLTASVQVVGERVPPPGRLRPDVYSRGHQDGGQGDGSGDDTVPLTTLTIPPTRTMISRTLAPRAAGLRVRVELVVTVAISTPKEAVPGSVVTVYRWTQAISLGRYAGNSARTSGSLNSPTTSTTTCRTMLSSAC